MTITTIDVAVIGAGFAGLAMAVRLREAGLDDVVLLERGGALGGTWRDNTYPGAACDIPSHLYSLSFHPKHDWSRTYARQPEIQAYLQEVADAHDLRRLVRLQAEVTSAAFDQQRGRWTVTLTDGGVIDCRALVSAVGALKDPAYPAIPGRGAFRGATMHSARWDHDVPLEGRRVGVIGTGASAIQLVPEIAQTAGSVTVFQRTPPCPHGSPHGWTGPTRRSRRR